MTSIQDAVEELSAKIRADLAAVSDKIEKEYLALLEEWPSARVSRRRKLLKEFQARLFALSTAAAVIARQQITGVIAAAYQLGASGVATSAGQTAAFSGVDTAAVAASAADGYADVLAATSHIRDDTKALIRTMTKQHISEKLVTGQTPAQASKALATMLVGQNITAITYSDGARHTLGDYTDMLVRTKTAEAHQLGGFAQARTIGIEYMEIMDGPGCGLASHQDARKANGLILPVDEAARYPLSHPRCRRVASARPDLSSPEQAATAQPIGPQFTAEDIARAHTDPSVTSKATLRSQATVAARKTNGTIVTSAGSTPRAVRAHRIVVARRAARTGP